MELDFGTISGCVSIVELEAHEPSSNAIDTLYYTPNEQNNLGLLTSAICAYGTHELGNDSWNLKIILQCTCTLLTLSMSSRSKLPGLNQRNSTLEHGVRNRSASHIHAPAMFTRKNPLIDVFDPASWSRNIHRLGTWVAGSSDATSFRHERPKRLWHWLDTGRTALWRPATFVCHFVGLKPVPEYISM